MPFDAPEAPKAPDPNVVAAAQTASNKETAIANANLNRIDQNGPQGSVKYTIVGTNADGTPKYQQDTTYSPETQAMFDNYTGLANKLGQMGQSQADAVSGILGKPLDLNTATENNIVALQQKRLDPQWQQQEDTMRTQLINQGIRPGTDAYDREMANFGNRKSSAYDDMYLNARQQGTQEALAQRSVPLNELTAMMSGNQVGNPQMSGVPGVSQANTDVAGITQAGFQNQMGLYNAQNAQNNAMMGGLFSIGASAAGAMPWSDRRLKKDIVNLGTQSNGLDDYEWTYKWGGPRYRGYMADEVEKVAPWAVGELHGFKFVRYGEI